MTFRITLSIAFSALTFGVSSQVYNELPKLIASDRDTSDRFGYAVDIDNNTAVVGAYADDFGANDPNMGSLYIFEKTGAINWSQTQKVDASDQRDYDRFGFSVAIKGDYMVVGAYQQDRDENGSNNVSNAGAAYIFEKIGGTWTEVQKIVASDRSEDAEFGHDVDIFGSTIVIGARADSTDENGLNPIYHAGSVYIFDRDGAGVWNETQKIVASDRSPDIVYPNGYSGEDVSDQFGSALAIWGDFLVVGAHHHDWDSTHANSLWSSGAAYFFERSAGIWSEVKKVNNADRESWDRFGYAVAIDSNVAVIGAYSEDEIADGVSSPLTNPGSAYIFERNTSGIWNQKQKIVPNDRNSGDHFAFAIELDGDWMVLGCESDDHDENDSNLKSNSGSAYIFNKSGGTWTEFQKIAASDRMEEDLFGYAVAMSGTDVIVGAFQHDFNTALADSMDDPGAAYIYTNNVCQTPIAQSQSPNICFGGSVSVGSSVYTIAGSYIDTLLSAAGCDSVVTTNLTVGPDLSRNDSISVCLGQTYTVGPNTYTSNGTYTDVFSSVDGCDSVITTVLNVGGIINVAVSQINNTIIANEASASYQWIDCGNGNVTIPGETNQTFVASSVGLYAVVVTVNGCSDTSSCLLVTTIVGVDDIKDVTVSILPNPNQGHFTITMESQNYGQGWQMEIFDISGKSIHTKHIENVTTEIDLNNISKGVYTLRLSNSSNQVFKRFVID